MRDQQRKGLHLNKKREETMLSNCKLYLTVVLLSFAIGACNMFGTSPFSSTESSTGIKPVHNTNSSNVEDLTGKRWNLRAYQTSEGDKVELGDAATTITITFNSNDSLSGNNHTNAQCNQYIGEYSAQDGGTMVIDTVQRITERYCGEFESKYLNTLSERVNKYIVNDGVLKLGFGENGVMQFYEVTKE